MFWKPFWDPDATFKRETFWSAATFPQAFCDFHSNVLKTAEMFLKPSMPAECNVRKLKKLLT